MEQAIWYFDIISPYAYLHFQQLAPLRAKLKIQAVPVLFAGLLKHWDNKGPAELAPKRLHTYQFCVWTASRQGVPFRMPARHPFNPLAAQRLLVSIGASDQQVHDAFHFVFGEGRDPETEFEAFAECLGVPDASSRVADPAVKQALMSNTQQAIEASVFGVPTLRVRGQNFWGNDTVEWTRAYLDDPQMFERPDYQAAAATKVGVVRS